MKKMMLMMAIVMTAVVLVAAGKPVWENAFNVELNRLQGVEKNYVAARAYVDEFDFTISQPLANDYVAKQLGLDWRERKLVSFDVLKTKFAEYSAKVGLTNKEIMDTQLLACAYNLLESKQPAYDFFKSITNPTDGMKNIGANTCVVLKKYDEAEALWLQTGVYDNLSMLAATYLKDKEKTFAYTSKAMLDKYCSPVALQQLLDRVGGFSYIGTNVSKQMQIDLLTELDNKYSRFLVKETNMKPEEKIWTPILTGIRLQKEKLLEPVTVVK